LSCKCRRRCPSYKLRSRKEPILTTAPQISPSVLSFPDDSTLEEKAVECEPRLRGSSVGQSAPERIVGAAGLPESEHRGVDGSRRTRSQEATRRAAAVLFVQGIDGLTLTTIYDGPSDQMPAYHAYPSSAPKAPEPKPLPNCLRLSVIVRRLMYLTFL